LDLFRDITLVLLGAAVAARLAVSAYFTQREHEMVVSRYLEGAVDHLAADLQRMMATLNHNWHCCLTLIKAYREYGEDFDLAELRKEFLEMASGNLNLTAHYRIYTIVRSHELWEVHQAAMSFFDIENDKLVHEIPDAIELKFRTDRVEASHAAVAETAARLAKEIQDNSQRFVNLASEYESLSRMLELKRLTNKELEKLKDGPEVKEILERLRENFKDVLSPSSTAPQPGAAADA